MPDPYGTFGLSCSSGGSFYICQDNETEFIGCCTVDPCRDGSGSCPQASLRNASFSADSYDGLKPQECAADTGALWYTCRFDKPPFLGCCASDPCASGSCPVGDLVPAKLSSDPRMRDIFVTTAASSTPSYKPASTAALSVSSTPTTSLTGTATPSTGGAGTGISTGTIAGISVGVTIIVLLLLAGSVFVFRRGWHARKRKERGSTTPFLSSPPEGGGFKSPVSSPPFTPYQDSQAYTSRSNTVGLDSPRLFGCQSPPTSNYAFSPHDGGVPGGALLPALAGHVRSASHASELGVQPPPGLPQELEAGDIQPRDCARHELPADLGAPAPAVSADDDVHVDGRPSEAPPLQPPLAGTGTPARRPSGESGADEDDGPPPQTPPRTLPPMLASPIASPPLVSRFSAAGRGSADGLGMDDSPTLPFTAASRRTESAS